MLTEYEAWETEDGAVMFPSVQLNSMHTNSAVRLTRHLYTFEAATGEEAAAIYSLRMGFGPHTPVGSPQPCPKCGAWFYPQGSGECWRCGKIC